MLGFIQNKIRQFIDWYYRDEIAEFDRIAKTIPKPCFVLSERDLIQSMELLEKTLNGKKIPIPISFSIEEDFCENLEFKEIDYCPLNSSFWEE